nr:hypothetical protein [Solirubrobacter pauli]
MLELIAHLGAGAVQQHALVAVAEAEGGADVLGRPALRSRRTITSCWRGGSAAIAASTCSSVSAASRRSSGKAVGGTPQAPSAVKRAGSTVGPPSSASNADSGTLRRSRSPRVRARLATIVAIQVFRLERPSKRSRPCRTPSHASCTTSSATAWLGTWLRAIRNISGPYRSTSSANAVSSPARSR